MSLLTDPITVHRQKPVNLAPDDELLFQHDYARQIPAARRERLTDVQLGESGTRWRGALPSQSVNRLAGQPLSPYRFTRAIVRECLQSETSVEDGVWICDAWSLEYFHWLADMLPKVLLAEEGLPIVLPHDALDRDYVKTSLEILQKRPATIPPGRRASFEQLDVITAVAPTGNFRPELVQAVRTRLVGERQTDVGDRLYISRARAPRRRILNERALEAIWLYQRLPGRFPVEGAD